MFCHESFETFVDLFKKNDNSKLESIIDSAINEVFDTSKEDYYFNEINLDLLHKYIKERVCTQELLTNNSVPTGEFGAILAFSIVISILAIIGNSLVIYASVSNKNSGPFRFIDGIIRSLAVADLLLGLIGNPFIVVSYYLGKYKMHLVLRIRDRYYTTHHYHPSIHVFYSYKVLPAG